MHLRLSHYTGSCNRFGKLSLEEKEHDKQRQNIQYNARTPNRINQHLIYTRVQTADSSHVCKHIVQRAGEHLCLRQEQRNRIVVIIIPYKAKQEYRDKRRNSVGNEYLKEGLERAAAVNISCLFKLLRKAAEELSVNENEQTALNTAGKQRPVK